MGDFDFDEDEWETSKRTSVLRTKCDSYSYRLTHDLSLDSFQSEDIFSLEYAGRTSPTGSVYSNESFTLCNKSKRLGSTSSSKDGSQADKLREDMIELSITEGDRSYPQGEEEGGRSYPQGEEEGDRSYPQGDCDEAKKLLSILDEGSKVTRKERREGEKEKGKGTPTKTKESSRRRQSSLKDGDQIGSHKSGERRKKSRRKVRKLPQMPSQRSGNLQSELMAADQRQPSSPAEDSQSPTDNCQPQSSTSPTTTPETPLTVLPSSQPARPSQLSLPVSHNSATMATVSTVNPPPPPPVLPHSEVPRNIVDSVSPHYTAFLSNTNLLLQEDSSPETTNAKRRSFPLRHRAPPPAQLIRRPPPPARQDDISDEENVSFQPVTLVIDGELKVQSHKALYTFFPRHDDELPMEVGDPVYVEVKGDDLWYDGINLRTGDEGCFPCRYVREFTVEADPKPGLLGRRVHIDRFRLVFLGSVETPFHRGNEVLCRAMQKVVMARRMTPDIRPATKCILEISDNGVRMIDQSKPPKTEEKKDSVRKKVEKFLSGKQKGINYYFSLKHISYCGFHPSSPKYFGFITKHPNDRRFACHVFITESAQSGQPLAEAMGAAFKRFYAEFLDYTNPTEDIYLE